MARCQNCSDQAAWLVRIKAVDFKDDRYLCNRCMKRDERVVMKLSLPAPEKKEAK